VSTLAEGRTVLREVQLYCPEHRGIVQRSKTARSLTLPRSPYGWDLVAHIGRQRYGEHRQIAEIHRSLCERAGVAVPLRTVDHLAYRFLEYWVAVHIESIPLIRAALDAQGASVLHLDATQENGTRPLFAVKEGLSGMVLWAAPVPSENKRDLATILAFVKDSFGTPVAAIRDMGKGVSWAAEDVFPETYILVCHFHFLRVIGNRLVARAYITFQRRINRSGVKVQLKRLLVSLRAKRERGPLEHRAEALVRHILAFQKDGEAMGAPFDLPDVTFYERCIEAEGTLRGWILDSASRNCHDVWVCRVEDALRALHPTPAHEGKLRNEYERLRERQRWFSAVREALRYRNGPVPLSTLVRYDVRELERAKKALAEFLSKLENAIEAPVDGPMDRGGRKTLRGIRDLILENEAHLLAPNVVVGEGERTRTILLPRTNNPIEQAFRAMRKHYRRIKGDSDIEGRMQREGAGMALLLNLGNPAYVRAVYGEESRIPERFRRVRPESLVLAQHVIQGICLTPNRLLPQ
jgi:hypothetical protein